MKPRYTELLPSYLDGPNIQGHGEIIDSSTDKIYNKNYLLEQWNNIPNRPILIRKIQEHGNAADIKVYCNSSYALKKITITGDYEANVEFSEEDVVTSYTFNIRILKSALTGETLEFAEETGIINPNLIITMEDYDQHTIQKAYPENDSIENNPYDHDPFLDIIGGLLTVKRRTYITYENTSENTANTYPAYFGKKLENNMISVCTEDDYYYLQRILYFIEKNGTEDIAKTMLKIVYELDCDVLNYNEDICKMDIHDMDEKYMADNTSQDVNTASYRIVPVWYSNITHPNEGELNQFIKPYLPVTRKVITTWKENVLITFEGIQERYCENGSFTIKVTDEEEEPITGLPLELHYGGLPEQVVTDENGEYLFEFGYPTGGGGALTVISQETDNYQSASNSCTYNVQKKTRTINYIDTETEVTPQGVLTISTSIRTAGSGRLSTNANGTITYSENNVVLAELDVVNGEINDFTTILSSGTHTILAHADLTYTGCTDGTRSINESITAIVPVELPVTLNPILMSATNDGISVDVEFMNESQTAYVSLDGTITLSITNGTTTTLLDTQTLTNESGVNLSSPSGSTFEDGTYTLLLELNATNPPTGYYYDNPITASETITISSKTEHSIGKNTENPWTTDMLYRGGIGTSGDSKDALTINYTNTPCIIVGVPFTGDFDVTLHMWMDCIQSPGNFGFTTSTNSVNTELKVNQNNINNTISIPNVFTTAYQIETIKIKREGTEYTYEQNNNTYTTTVSSTNTVYFYMQKSGGCTLVLDDMTYII